MDEENQNKAEEKENKDSEAADPHEDESEDGGMSFLDHLEELRKRLIFVLITAAVGCIIAGVFIDFLVEDVFLEPFNVERKLTDTIEATTASGEIVKIAKEVDYRPQAISPMEKITTYFQIIFIAGIIISFPGILYQVWKFIAPGLYASERKWAFWITVLTSISFLGGVAFAYFVMIPIMMDFLLSFGTENIETQFRIKEYGTFFYTLILAAGILFELPMATFVLARVGILTSKFMRKYRKHSIVVILILAAIITPTPDPFNQMVLAVPLFALYEISVLVAKFAEKQRRESAE